MVCPNKNLKEWQELVELVGEDMAYNVYVSNDNTIPVIEGDESELLNEMFVVMPNKAARTNWLLTKTVEFKEWYGKEGEPILYRDEKGLHYMENASGDRRYVTESTESPTPVVDEVTTAKETDTNFTLNSPIDSGKNFAHISQVEEQYGLRETTGGLKAMTASEANSKASEINKKVTNLNASIVVEDGKYYVKLASKRDIELKMPSELISFDFDEMGVFDDPDIPLRNVFELQSNKKARLRKLQSQHEKALADKDLIEANRIQNQIGDIQADLEFIHDSMLLSDVSRLADEDIAYVTDRLNSADLAIDELFNLRKTVHLWMRGIDLFLTEDESNTPAFQTQFERIASRASTLEKHIKEAEDIFLDEVLQRYTKDGNFSYARAAARYQDISTSYLRDLGMMEDVMFQAIDSHVKQAEFEAHEEIRELHKDIDGRVAQVKNVLGSEGFDIFFEKFSDGRYTGNLISPYSAEYYETMGEKYSDASRGEQSLAKFFDWKKHNQIILDPSILYPLDGKKHPKYDETVAKLKDHVGEKGFQELNAALEQKLIAYNEAKQSAIESIKSMSELSPEQKNLEIDLWIKTYSPYEYAYAVESGRPIKVGNTLINSRGWEYTFEVPIRFHEFKVNDEVKRRPTGFYNDSFSEIESNPEVFEFYKFVQNTFNNLGSYLSYDQKTRLQRNGLPSISTTLMEDFDKNGVGGAFSKFIKNTKNIFRAEETPEISYKDRDVITGETDRSLSIDFINDHHTFIDSYVKRKKIEWKLDRGDVVVPLNVVKEFKREAKDIVARENSQSIEKILKVFSTSVIGYKHKSKVEDLLLMSKRVLDRTERTEVNTSGTAITNAANRPLKEGEKASFKNKRAMLSYYVDAFYGDTQHRQVVPPNKVTDMLFADPTEKQIKSEINELLARNEDAFDNGDITRDEYLNTKSQLEENLDAIKVTISTGGVVNGILRYVQLKAMGWNAFSAISNMGFGFISNYILAGDGRTFTSEDLEFGYKMTSNSVLNNWTFNKVGEWRPQGTARKIRSLMGRFDVLKDARFELNNVQSDSVFSKAKFLSPYNMQTRSEYVNQAPIMIAIMRHTKLNKLDGTESNMWEGYNPDGSWNVEEYGELDTELAFSIKKKIDITIKRAHGNYDPSSPLRANQYALGRALKQFRTWMLEGMAVRFESERYDHDLGYSRKGRYRTLLDLSNKSSISPAFSNDGFQKSLALAKGILLKATRQYTGILSLGKFKVGKEENFEQFVDGSTFTATDAANLRMIVNEVMLFINIKLLMALLTSGLDDEEKNRLLNWLANQTTRLNTDMLMYINPLEFEKLTQSSIPAIRLIDDLSQWGDAFSRYIKDPEKDTIKTGIYAGHSRLFRQTMKLLPFGTQVYRNYSAASQVFK